MNVVLAAFEHRPTAQFALEQLAKSGFPRDDLHVEHELEHLRALARPGPPPAGFLGALGQVFADLVTNTVDAHQQDLVRAAVQRGAAVLVLRCGEPDRAQHAVKLLRSAGAFNVAVGAPAGSPH